MTHRLRRIRWSTACLPTPETARIQPLKRPVQPAVLLSARRGPVQALYLCGLSAAAAARALSGKVARAFLNRSASAGELRVHA